MLSDKDVKRIGTAIADLIKAIDRVQLKDIKLMNDDVLAKPIEQRPPEISCGLQLGRKIIELKKLISKGRQQGHILEQ